MNIPKATIDFETRSTCNLKHVGAWKYSLDPTTEILCLVFRLPHWAEGRTSLWHPLFPQLGLNDAFETPAVLELLDWIEAGGLIEAHNAFFERAIWANILVPRYGWPSIPSTSWRCSAAKAAAHAIPRKLEDAGIALSLPLLKSVEGHKLMLKLCKPRKSRKKEREAWVAVSPTAPHPTVWWETLPLFESLWAYCRQDVLAEEALSHELDDLDLQETQYYILDQTLNERGFHLDQEAVGTALSLIADEVSLLNDELSVLTQGQVCKATQREKMKTWLRAQGVNLFDTQGTTIDQLLSDDEKEYSEDDAPWSIVDLPVKVRRALEILRTLGRSSTAKYETMRQWVCPDGRVRGGLLYHGATTGRWSGAGVQPHNFPKGTIKGFEMDAAWTLLKTGDRQQITAVYPSVMETLACALRGAITAAPGHQLYVADYASIECRVLLWLAHDEEALGIFRRHEDPYCVMASDIYNRPITKRDIQERQLGKAAVLGCGYQMGASKFVATAATYGVTIDEEFSKQVVDTYREKFWRVKQLWWDTEGAACTAVKHPGKKVQQGYVLWQCVGRFLFCTLPSGRRLAYPDPELRDRTTPWGAVKASLTFKGVNPYNKQWQRQTTYGGSLVENIVQAISRDLMAAALLRCEQSGIYLPVLSVHDEVITEALDGVGSVQEFTNLLTQLPVWANGCPIEAEGWVGKRYHK